MAGLLHPNRQIKRARRGRWLDSKRSAKPSAVGTSRAIVSIVCWLFALFAIAPVSAQELTFADAKARYLIEVCKHVDWPKDTQLDAYDVAVVTTDRATRRAFERLGSIEVKGKPVAFRFFANTEFDTSSYSLIYLGEKFRSANDALFGELANTLIVVDGDVDREQLMISLVESGGQVSIKLNRENLIRFGFAPSIALLDFAGTREDLTKELRQKQSRLRSVLDEVESKEQQLRDLDQQMESNSTNLLTAGEALAGSEKELALTRQRLASYTDEVARTEREVADFRVQLADQQALFESKRGELAFKQISIAEKVQVIADLEADIVDSRAVLEKQLLEIDQQRSLLERKNETISAQREGMLFISAALLIFLVIAFFLMRLNKLRTRANLDLEKLNSQLYELATTDSLSGLFNRRQFMNSANDAFRYHKSVRAEMALLMMDIDNFKRVNDQYGHAAGDLVIKAVGDCLSRNLREFDLLGRVGGEEYAMMLVGCDKGQSVEIGNRLCRDVADLQIEHQGEKLGVKISIGVAQLALEDPDIERALSQSDKALYQAKARGRNQVVAYEHDPRAAEVG